MEIGELLVEEGIVFEKILQKGGVSYFLVESRLNPLYELYYVTKVDVFNQNVDTTLLSYSEDFIH